MKIDYVNGDVREPIGGKGFIIHCVNDIGVMGAGVARALYDKWPQVRSEYMKMASLGRLNLGSHHVVLVEKDLAVVNMVGQSGVGMSSGKPPIRYPAMEKCLKAVSTLVHGDMDTVHVPYLMGCDLAGGKWEKVELMIRENLCKNNIKVIVYDLFGKRRV